MLLCGLYERNLLRVYKYIRAKISNKVVEKYVSNRFFSTLNVSGNYLNKFNKIEKYMLYVCIYRT